MHNDPYNNFNLENLISKEINKLGFDFIGLEILNQSKVSKLIKVYIDLKEVGVTLDDCAKVSYTLSKVLNVYTNLSYNNYTLEVSSPGVERKLFNLLQIKEQVGKEITIKLKFPVTNQLNLLVDTANRINFTGMLLDVNFEEKKIFMRVEGQEFCFNYDNVAKANLVYRKL